MEVVHNLDIQDSTAYFKEVDLAEVQTKETSDFSPHLYGRVLSEFT